MEQTNKAEFEIQISISDTTDEELDDATRRLLAEVRDLNVELAELAKSGSAPEGSKGDPITMGAIVITVLPAVLPSLITFIQAWTLRGQGRTVKFKGKVGKNMIEFEGSPEELRKLIASLR